MGVDFVQEADVGVPILDAKLWNVTSGLDLFSPILGFFVQNTKLWQANLTAWKSSQPMCPARLR